RPRPGPPPDRPAAIDRRAAPRLVRAPLLPEEPGRMALSRQTAGSSWASVWAGAKRSPRSATRSTIVRIVQAFGRRPGSSSSSQLIGADTGAPAAGRTAYGATRVLIEAFWV